MLMLMLMHEQLSGLLRKESSKEKVDVLTIEKKVLL
jgi:hypothetical protein